MPPGMRVVPPFGDGRRDEGPGRDRAGGVVTVRTHALARPGVRPTGRAVLLVVVVVMLGVFSAVPVRAYLAQRTQLAQLEQRATELERSNEELRSNIRQLHDPEYLERLARACLGMVKPGEVAFVSRSSGSDRAC
jgi:cell division protein FtsB